MPLTTVSPGVMDTQATATWRNRLINGDMRIDQRSNGASFTVSSLVYTLDRWASFAAGGSVSVQRVSGSASGFQNAVQITGGSGVTQAQFYQRIESNNCWDLASSPVTLSFTASSSSLTSLSAYFGAPTSGAADNWSSGATLISQSGVTISSTPTRYTITTTLNAAAANGLQVMFFTPAFTSGTLTITGVQLEAGTAATAFERRDYGRELMMCQRYCYVITGGASGNELWGLFLSGFTTTRGFSLLSLPVPLRAGPTITQSNSFPANLALSSVGSVSGIAAFQTNGSFVTLDVACTGLSSNTPFLLALRSTTLSAEL